jgi:hypothetical protein
MTLTEYPDLIQGSEEWLAIRRGIVTASTVGLLLSVSKPGAQEYVCTECAAPAGEPCISKRGGAAIKTMHSERATVASQNAATARNIVTPSTGDVAHGLTLSLVAERITGYTEPTWVNDDMARGIRDEPLARDLYSETYEPATEVGFMVRDDWGFKIGYSPDGIVGKDGAWENKSRRQKTQLATVLADAVPTPDMAQLQCGLLVSRRKWIDYTSWSGGMAMWTKRVYPDIDWFIAIVDAVRMFETAAAEMIATYTARTAGLPTTERIIDLEIVI